MNLKQNLPILVINQRLRQTTTLTFQTLTFSPLTSHLPLSPNPFSPKKRKKRKRHKLSSIDQYPTQHNDIIYLPVHIVLYCWEWLFWVPDCWNKSINCFTNQ
uniref:Uncharacterized protein n=1 Tax=Cacopsylla melanoneura TaxID=428564 RepID=A0A8D9AS31_9HEMI